MVKNLFANAGDVGDSGSILGSGRSPGMGNGKLLAWKIPWRVAWPATIHEVTKTRT